jgi:DNA polymerase (family 10)
MVGLNKEVAEILAQIGAMLEIKGENQFRVRAYYNASRQVEGLPVDIQTVARENKLSEVPGIGKGLAEKIDQYIRTGQMTYYEELKKTIPDGLLEMLKIPSVGPRTVKTLYEELGIKTVQELEYACNENRLLKLRGFGQRSQEKVLEGIKFFNRSKGQFLLNEAIPPALELLQALKGCPHVQRVSLAGSIRRWKETVKDIDLVASSKRPAAVMDVFTRHPLVEAVLARGETKSSVRLSSGIQSDLRVVEDAQFPYAIHHFTGSKEHNVAMRTRAQLIGLKINEYGLFRGNRLIKCKDEEELFKALGLQYIPPELRENMGEIDAAEKGRLPRLVEDKEILGTFHIHTNWSDGTAPIEEIAKIARGMGYKYIGLSEHSKAAAYARGLDEARLKRWIAEVDRINKRFHDFRILKGIEAEILKDGSLDIREDLLRQLDFVIGAIHSHFTLSEDQMTDRVIKALSNSCLDILSHPSGRLLLGREPYRINLGKVLEAASRYQKTIELNANPQRLDLDWIHLKRAKELGVKIVIGPDAHRPDGIQDTRYGIATARRGWLTKQDLLNTYSVDRLLKFFSKVPGKSARLK